MTKRWPKFASISKVGVIALALLVTLWAGGSSPSEAQQDGMHNCPQAGKWAISVWDGADGSETGQALATCGAGVVDFAYYLDPATNGWLGYFEGRPEVSKLLTLDNMQGIIAHGAVGAPPPTPTPTPTVGPQEDAMHNCPQAGKWAISVWSGADGTATGQALATCGPGDVDFAYSLDPGTNGWLGYFEGRPEVSKLLTLNNLQGIVAHGSAGFSLAVDKFGEGSITSSPGGIDCGTDCTSQAANYPSGTTVVLTPTADPGSTFSHWSGCDSVSGDSCTVDMDGDHTVFATFAFSEVKIPETTKVLDAATMGYLIRQEGSTYYFSPQAQAVAALQPGDVIVSGVGEGFIRKVTAVNATADEVAVATTDATLEDAIEQGTIIVHQRLTPADVQSAQVLPSGARTSADMAAASLMDFNVDIDAELMPGVKAYGSASLSADLEIAASFDGWDWGCLCFPVKEARAVLVTENATELGLSAKASFSFSKEKEIAKYDFAPIWVMVGSVPVGFFPELSVAVGVEGHAGAKMESKVTLDNTYAVGVRYRRGSGWSPVNDYSRDFDFAPPTLSAEAEAKAYVAPELSVKVYGLVGPYFGLEGYLRLNAQPLETPWWSLYGGIGASAGFEAEALGVGLGNYSWPVWSKEWLLAQAGEGPTPGPALSGRLAFASSRDSSGGNLDIYVMNADGSGLGRLTNNAADDNCPAWSPDGSKIAFDSDRDGDFEIYVMNADGSSPTRLTHSPGVDYDPAWSPDGSKIVFYSSRDGNDEIYVMNADGSSPTRLTHSPGLDWKPAWSPDGSKIAFDSDRDGDFEVYVMSGDGSDLTKLTDNSAVDAAPSWSPDGSWIAFHSDRDGNLEVYVMKANGSGQTNLTGNSASDYGPVWSPQGTWIAFTSERDGNREVYVMDADGSGQTRLTTNEADDYRPAWSP
jgi:hypothetical protein